MRITLLLMSVLTGIFSFAQNRSDSIGWPEIESAILGNKNLQDTRDRLSHIKEEAVNRHDDIAVARALYLMMLIDDRRTEDSLFFYNSAFIDSTLSSNPSPQLAAIMHLLKAGRLRLLINKFSQNGDLKRFRNIAREVYFNKDRLDAGKIDSVIQASFQKVFELTPQLNNVDISRIRWLAGDPLALLYKAGFADIVYQGKILYSQRKRQAMFPSASLKLLSLSADELMRQPDSAIGPLASHQSVFGIYKEWMHHHYQKNPASFYFIDEMVRQYLFDETMADSNVTEVYEKYLEQQLSSPYGGVKALAVLQLTERWVNYAGRYSPYAYSNFVRSFDTSVRYYNVKAFQLISQYRPALDSFGVIQALLDGLMKRILLKTAEWGAEQQQLPGKPILTYLKYRNVRQLYVRIVRTGAEQIRTLNPRISMIGNASILDTVLKLPGTEDYQLHTTYLKLDPLPVGRYYVFYSDRQIQPQDSVSSFSLDVTNIAVLNNDQRVFVLNRTTGFPLEHARVWIDGKPEKLNRSGYLNVKDPDAEIMAVIGRDTVVTYPNDPPGDLPREVYNKDDYDNLLEYYEENIKLRLFTDRAIYRPGQTVYYKGIFMIPDIRTGEYVVLNWKNLQFSFIKKLFYKIRLKFKKEKIALNISDAFGKDFATQNVWPDQFGAVDGSFVLPKNAATGEWEFDTDDIEIENSFDGSFTVEEYKRPSFEVTIDKPSTALKLGDAFPVVIKVRSFAGAKLENISLKYLVTASGSIRQQHRTFDHRDDTLLMATGSTDSKGELRLTVSDSNYFRDFVIPDDESVDVNYHVEVQAIDNIGESHTAKTSISLSTRYITLKAQIPAMVDRAKPVPYYISASSAFAGELKKSVNIKLFRLHSLQKEYPESAWFIADTWLYPAEELRQLFPDVDLDMKLHDDRRSSPVFETMINTGDEKLQLPGSLLVPGKYELEFTTVENGKITGMLIRSFKVLDSKERLLPDDESDFHYMPVNSINEGQVFSWYTGNANEDVFSVYHITWFDRAGRKIQAKNAYDIIPQPKGLTEWTYRAPVNTGGRMLVTHQYIKNNHLYFKEENIYVNSAISFSPELIVEKYRTKLRPGEKEVFRVSFRTRDMHEAAQLMTTMYDASLDKLKKHVWKVVNRSPRFNLSTAWDRSITTTSSGKIGSFSQERDIYEPVKKAVWWSDAQLDDDISGLFLQMPGTVTLQALEGRASGVNITASAMNLQDVVVVGYGSMKTNSFISSSISIRGAASLSGYNKMLVVLDGVVIETDISKIDVNTITSGVVLKGADASALYGSRAVNGVLLLSTKGPVQIPAAKEEPVQVRKNFNETAFFYPKILADRKGWFTVSFALPESVTEWKWKMLAHTKKGQFAYEEKTIVSQLPMMVQPDIPRFLYQGDQVVLKSRISNLDSNEISGVVKCVIEDMVTGVDLSPVMLSSEQQLFSVKSMGNGMVSFRLSIPDTMIHPLRIRIVASGKNMSDGEEHIIPVLSPKTLVAQTVPMVAGSQSPIVALPSDAIPYGVSAYLQPTPFAALLNALPYLSQYPFNCTEQTFNKILAHAVAVKLMRSNQVLQQSFGQRRKQLPADVSGVDSLAEGRGESMPWLQLEFSAAQHQRQLYSILDTLAGKEKINDFFELIKKNQQTDGGLSWFEGGKSDPYISLYLLAAAGKMKADSLPFLNDQPGRNGFSFFIQKLIGYCFRQKDLPVFNTDNIQWLYARSFWVDELSADQLQASQTDSIAAAELSRIDQYVIGRQAMLISAVLRMYPAEHSLYKNGLASLESIRQQAISDRNGIRWKSMADKDDFTTRDEEWLVKIAEAFAQSGTNQATVDGIMLWLLGAKQDHNWSSTKSTGDVVTLFSRYDRLSQPPVNNVSVNAGSFTLSVADDPLNGNLTAFHNLYGKTFPRKMEIKATSTRELKGAVNFYYFTTQPPENTGGPALAKKLMHYNEVSKQWELLKESAILHPGEKIRVQLTVETARRLKYVWIDDKRAAAFEPAEALSGYAYENGLSYYRSIADEGFRFFFNEIPSGRSEISYEMVVAKEGLFSNGVSSLECIYQPDVKAYSGNFRVNVKSGQ